MKILKIKSIILAGMLSISAVASADLVANIPLNNSRFDTTQVADLVNQAKAGNPQAQIFLTKR